MVSNEDERLSRIRNNFSKFSSDNIICIERKTTAYSNYVYSIKTDALKNNLFIYKEYQAQNELIDKENETAIQESVGFPTIVHADKDFRIEVYVEHTSAEWNRDADHIAVRLREFHDLGIEDCCGFTIYDLIDHLIAVQNIGPLHTLYTAVKEGIMYDLNEEEPPVLCHNDLQIGNIMRIGGDVRFIDFEYSCKANRFYDVANLFCETMCDYSVDSELLDERGWSHSEKMRFLERYTRKDNCLSEYDKVERLTYLSHFFWFLWARYMFVNKAGPSDSFDYKQYALSRLGHIQFGDITEDEVIEECVRSLEYDR